MRPYKRVNNSEFQPNSIIVSSELNMSGKSNLTALSFGTDNKNCANTRKVGIGAVIYASSG